MVFLNNSLQLDFEDVLIMPENADSFVNPDINHRSDINIIRNFDTLNFSGVPVMSSNMTQTGTFNIAKKLLKNNWFASLHKFYSANDIIRWIGDTDINTSNLFITVGLRNSEQELKKLAMLHDAGVKYNILIDVPNANIFDVQEYVKQIRKLYPDTVIAVGNVATGCATQHLIDCGANIIKVGIGPSQVCDTRIKTGCGRPQLSAIIECATIAHQNDAYIIADGGYKCNGDICKALVAGADICMSGSLFAGCDESAGDIKVKYHLSNECTDQRPHVPMLRKSLYKDYYGMSSFRAQEENYGAVTSSGTSEGVESKLVPYTGPVQKTINDINGSLRSCGTYIGAKDISMFARCGGFYRVNRVK